jgi:RND family efflux transporter MFP subunit
MKPSSVGPNTVVKSLKTLNNPLKSLKIMNIRSRLGLPKLSALTLTLTLLFTACGKKDSESAKTPGIEPIPVKLEKIEQLNSQRAITVGGLLGTENEARLSFKTGGIIQRIHVKVGDAVRRGQLLATLDLTEITAGVNQAQLGFEKAQRDYDRAKALHRDSVATLEMLQNAQTGLEFARQTLESVKFNQTHSAIHATADGFVLAKLMNEGELAGPGMPILALSTTSGQSHWVLRAGLSDKEWSLIQPGDSATITLDAYPDRTFNGSVTRKSQGADPYSGAFQVEVTVELQDVKPAAGLFGQATILPRTQGKYWMLPYESVLEADGNEAFVFVTRDRKTATKVPVKVAYLAQNRVAISGGLEGFPEVITTGSAYLTDKSPITIAQ